MHSTAGQICSVVTNGKGGVKIEWLGPNNNKSLNVDWEFDIADLEYSDDKQNLYKMSVLSIRNLTERHFGRYECRVKVESAETYNYFEIVEKIGNYQKFSIYFLILFF